MVDVHDYDKCPLPFLCRFYCNDGQLENMDANLTFIFQKPGYLSGNSVAILDTKLPYVIHLLFQFYINQQVFIKHVLCTWNRLLGAQTIVMSRTEKNFYPHGLMFQWDAFSPSWQFTSPFKLLFPISQIKWAEQNEQSGVCQLFQDSSITCSSFQAPAS